MEELRHQMEEGIPPSISLAEMIDTTGTGRVPRCIFSHPRDGTRVGHNTQTPPGVVIRTPLLPTQLALWAVVEQEVQNMLQLGVIE